MSYVTSSIAIHSLSLVHDCIARTEVSEVSMRRRDFFMFKFLLHMRTALASALASQV